MVLLLAVLRRLFCFGSLVVLDVVFRCLPLFLLCVDVEMCKDGCLVLDWPVAACVGG